MKIELYSKSVEETQAIADILCLYLEAGDTIAFSGDLGAGKTTFIKQVAHNFDIDRDDVTSMSFVLARQHEGRLPILHTDVYRLGDMSELPAEILEFVDDANGLLLMEWAENIGFDAIWNVSLSQERLDERFIEISSNDPRIKKMIPHLEKYVIRL